ncbi:KAT8 regulatory NSL complex subunit 1-like protein [Caerostris extrusa]|uniref:KAT8 regulatory NSL complex subunit 1-like protein n=1 Tax=Caerostris extrusa TaxID=172846 RepID=A0AAV4N7Q9_CAEEX|nr:KAT8 regulatory NSL complex subunit 1-like protein [Caerostris extrusa]
MAPALTKADRRADCLPVVLPFCVSKTADPENRKDNDYNLAKFQKIACWLNKRKYMNKAWFRAYVRNTSELSDKNRYSQIDLRKSLLSSKLRINAEARNKSWHGTNVTLAVADKVRLKYTMNKNNNSIRNMGLARANTSLGLHSMKKMNRITQLPHRDKGNPSNLTHELGESSPELPDPANVELETPYRIVKLVQGTEELSSSSDLNCNMAPSKENALSTTNNQSSDIVSVSVNSDVPLSISPNDVEASLCDSNLSVILTDSKCSLNTAKNLDSGIVKLPVPETNSIQLLLPEVEDTPVSDIESKATSVIEEESLVLPHLSNEDIIQEASNFKDSELHDSSVDHLNCIASLPSPLCDVHVQDDIADITASLEARTSPFSIPSPCSPSRLFNDGSDVESDSLTSSTLSADASPIPSSVEEGVEKVFITFPDSFLASPSGVHKELAAPAFSDVACLSIDNSDFIGSDDEMHIMRKTCCPPADQDLSFFRDRLIEHERKISNTLKETEALLRMHSMDHIHQQIRSFVQHFQKKLMIPCQRQHKMGISKNNRNLVDLKAELLQNEDVKNLSTAALVSLVRTWSNPSTGNLPPQNAILQDSELRNKLISTFTPEDIDDVKNASKIFLKNMKKLLRSADPELTESSDDGSSDLEQSEESPAQKKALWKFMKQRAALASRATLLTAKIRELENQLRTVAGYLTKVNSSYGDLRFENQRTSTTSTLPIFVSESSGDVSLESAMKQNKPKSLNRPVNGYLDHGPINNTIHVGTTNSYTSVCLEQKLSNRIDAEDTCSRTRALKTSNFHKRKLLVTTGLHLTNPKSAKLSTVNCVCNCQDAILPCILCTGRYNCIQSVDPDSMPLLDRVALLDPPFHPHLSFEKDISLLMHFENILKKNEAQYQSERSASPSSHRRLSLGTKQRHLNDTKSHGRKLKRYSHLSEKVKYRKRRRNISGSINLCLESGGNFKIKFMPEIVAGLSSCIKLQFP